MLQGLKGYDPTFSLKTKSEQKWSLATEVPYQLRAATAVLAALGRKMSTSGDVISGRGHYEYCPSEMQPKVPSPLFTSPHFNPPDSCHAASSHFNSLHVRCVKHVDHDVLRNVQRIHVPPGGHVPPRLLLRPSGAAAHPAEEQRGLRYTRPAPWVAPHPPVELGRSSGGSSSFASDFSGRPCPAHLQHVPGRVRLRRIAGLPRQPRLPPCTRTSAITSQSRRGGPCAAWRPPAQRARGPRPATDRHSAGCRPGVSSYAPPGLLGRAPVEPARLHCRRRRRGEQGLQSRGLHGRGALGLALRGRQRLNPRALGRHHWPRGRRPGAVHRRRRRSSVRRSRLLHIGSYSVHKPRCALIRGWGGGPPVALGGRGVLEHPALLDALPDGAPAAAAGLAALEGPGRPLLPVASRELPAPWVSASLRGRRCPRAAVVCGSHGRHLVHNCPLCQVPYRLTKWATMSCKLEATNGTLP